MQENIEAVYLLRFAVNPYYNTDAQLRIDFLKNNVLKNASN